MTPPYRIGTDPSTDSLRPNPSTDSYVRTYPQTDRERDQVERDGFLLSNAREIEPYYSDDRATLYRGDALAVLRDLPDASVDAVITDPPYSSGGAMRGDRTQATTTKYSLGKSWPGRDGVASKPTQTYEGFTGDTRDQRGYLVWSSMWMTECQRVLKPGGTFAVFTDWRQLPTTTDAVQAGGLVWRAVAVWDKGVGRPVKGRFRNHVEYVVWATNGPHSDPQEVYPSTVLRHSSPTSANRVHLTEKPVGLVEELLTLTPAGCVVLDPFMGSGTTGVAAVKTGRAFIGVEMAAHYFGIAQQRIAAAGGALDVDDPQGDLFGGAA